MFSLQNKSALITGGGSGIGQSISILFARQGANVLIVDLDEKRSQETVEAIRKDGGKASFVKCNLAVKDEVDKVVGQLVGSGHLDIVVNNAGIAHVGNIETTTAEDFDRLIAVNIKGVFHTVQATLPYLKMKGGVILNMASISAHVGIPDRFAYTMTKGAVMGMTISLARDLMKYQIRCNSISPARVHTPFVDGFVAKNFPGHEEEMMKKLAASQPIGRMGKPEEIASLALYLCSDEASFVTGCDYPIDGGFAKLNT